MKEAIELLLKLQTAKGSIAKRGVLKAGAENEQFRKLLNYALNPYLTYKVSEKTLAKQWEFNPEISIVMTDFFDVCEYLAGMKAMDDTTLYQLRGFLDAQDESLRLVYTKILCKTLRLGVTAKTVNKVIPGLIPEWEVQQAYPIEKYPLKNGTWFSISEKLNGVRATYYDGNLYARSGEVYKGLDHILAVFHDYRDKYVLDGELTLADKSGLSDNEAFRKATGLINSESEDKTCICFTVFDMLPKEEFACGQSSLGYAQRRQILDGVQNIFDDVGPVRRLCALYSGYDQSVIEPLLDQMVCQDKEGLMLNLDVPYKRKRHNGILKIKRFYTMDLPIITVEEGTGRLEGTTGAFVLDYKGNKVRVGSGFTDEQRAEFWNMRDDLPGKLCEVKYKEISSDKNTKTQSLQFPVFVAIRADKSEISYA